MNLLLASCPLTGLSYVFVCSGTASVVQVEFEYTSNVSFFTPDSASAPVAVTSNDV